MNLFSPKFHFLWCFVIATEKKVRQGSFTGVLAPYCGYTTEENVSPFPGTCELPHQPLPLLRQSADGRLVQIVCRE